MNFNELTADNGLFCDGDWIEKKDQDESGNVRLIQLADIGVGEFKDKSRRYITEEKCKELNCTMLKKGDLLIARLPDPLGRACIFPLEGKYITAVDISIVRFDDANVDKYYLMHLINSVHFRRKIKEYESGTTRKRISRKNLGKIDFTLPDIQEQQRIVSGIEELFSKLDVGIKELKIIQEKLDIYKQAVLKEAFNEYTKWKKVTFSDLLIDMRNGYGKKPTDTGKNKILKISAVRSMKLNLNECRYNEFKVSDTETIKKNDLLFTRYNGSRELVGVCAVVPELDEDYGFPDKIIRCRLKMNNTIHARFLQYYINQGEARMYIRSKIKTTSGQNGIAGSDIKKLVVYLPSLEIQKKIVLHLDDVLFKCDAICNNIASVIEKADVMRQSILKQAFEGRL